jgi:hypothetical protein
MNILLYAPELTGHPQVYCRNLCDTLTEAGHRVVIAAGTDERTWCDDWRDLRPLAANGEVCLVDTRRFSRACEARLLAGEIVELQKAFNIDSTLFVEGDYFEQQFREIAANRAPRLRGKVAAIFAMTSTWYPCEQPYTGRPEPLWNGGLRGCMSRCKRSILNRKETARYFYEKVLARGRVVDAVVVKDERITERYGPPFFWMPEIYKVFRPQPEEEDAADWDQFAKPVQEYFSRAGAKNVILYYGTGTWYKGYDYFLRLLELDPSAYGLHLGAPQRSEPKAMSFDTCRLRKELLEQDRLFETRAFVKSDALTRLAFSMISGFISTHRLIGSSGTVLQALDAGKPVLVPSCGLIGHRVRTNGLGMVYKHLDDFDLLRAWREFRGVSADRFSDAIENYMKRFSYEEFSQFFTTLLSC